MYNIHIWENYGSQVIGENALVEIDCKALDHQYLIVFFWRSYCRKVATDAITFSWCGQVCPAMAKHAQTYRLLLIGLVGVWSG